jgi:hypothetical protein
MRSLLLAAVLLITGSLRSEGQSAPSVREKLRARILETLPSAPPARPTETQGEPESPVFVLEPMVVTESKGGRELAKVLAEDKERQEAERFSVVKGGKIYSSERLDVGFWWSPASGWQLLKIKW